MYIIIIIHAVKLYLVQRNLSFQIFREWNKRSQYNSWYLFLIKIEFDSSYTHFHTALGCLFSWNQMYLCRSDLQNSICQNLCEIKCNSNKLHCQNQRHFRETNFSTYVHQYLQVCTDVFSVIKCRNCPSFNIRMFIVL